MHGTLFFTGRGIFLMEIYGRRVYVTRIYYYVSKEKLYFCERCGIILGGGNQRVILILFRGGFEWKAFLRKVWNYFGR